MSRGELRLRKKQLENILLEAMTLLSSRGYIGEVSKEAREWYREHKERDKERDK